MAPATAVEDKIEVVDMVVVEEIGGQGWRSVLVDGAINLYGNRR